MAQTPQKIGPKGDKEYIEKNPGDENSTGYSSSQVKEPGLDESQAKDTTTSSQSFSCPATRLIRNTSCDNKRNPATTGVGSTESPPSSSFPSKLGHPSDKNVKSGREILGPNTKSKTHSPKVSKFKKCAGFEMEGYNFIRHFLFVVALCFGVVLTYQSFKLQLRVQKLEDELKNVHVNFESMVLKVLEKSPIIEKSVDRALRKSQNSLKSPALNGNADSSILNTDSVVELLRSPLHQRFARDVTKQQMSVSTTETSLSTAGCVCPPGTFQWFCCHNHLLSGNLVAFVIKLM